MDSEPAAPSSSDSDEQSATEKAREEVANTHFDARTASLILLAVLAVFYTLYFAAGIVLPFLFAIVLNLLLQPAKRLLNVRLHIPAALTALLLVIALFSVIAVIAAAISVPASGWIAKAPQTLPTLQQRLGFLAKPIDFIRHGADQLQHMMQSPGSGGGEQQQSQQQPQQVAVQSQSNLGGVGMTILEGTRAVLGQLLTLVVVLFFLLTAGDTLLRRLVEIIPSFGDKRRVVEIADEIEGNISAYLATITVMNLLVGIANGISMWSLGMPDPLLWGTLAFLLNYIPILGPITGMVIFFFVGLFSSSNVWMALAPPGIYLVIHIIEGETVTPMLLARRFTLNPVLVIVALFFWDWLWGVPGALLAVPLLAIFKIFCDRIPVLTPLGHMLGAPAKEESGIGRRLLRSISPT